MPNLLVFMYFGELLTIWECDTGHEVKSSSRALILNMHTTIRRTVGWPGVGIPYEKTNKVEVRGGQFPYLNYMVKTTTNVDPKSFHTRYRSTTVL